MKTNVDVQVHALLLWLLLPMRLFSNVISVSLLLAVFSASLQPISLRSLRASFRYAVYPLGRILRARP